eukprot:scaffold23004_cov54-Phaeocystis_antarctica.AAC.2
MRPPAAWPCRYGRSRRAAPPPPPGTSSRAACTTPAAASRPRAATRSPSACPHTSRGSRRGRAQAVTCPRHPACRWHRTRSE